jgi:hypothetical protein
MIVASGMRALTTGPFLPAAALAVAAWAAAKAAAGTARKSRSILGTGPVAGEAVARILSPSASRGTFEASWTHVEMRWPG